MNTDTPRNKGQIDGLSKPPPFAIPKNEWMNFCEWARDGGYDQSYFNRFDSKGLALQEQCLEEQLEQQATEGTP